MPKLCIVVPVLNESANVPVVVRRVREALGSLDWELVFVDDDSRDGTSDAVLAQAALDPRVRLILRVADPGLSNSCIQGMLSSTAPLLCVMDGDGQHDPAIIPRMIALLEEGSHDIVSACRDLDGQDAQSALGGRRTLISRTGNALIRAAIGREARDALSGFILIRREAFLGVVRGLSNSGFKLLFDILATGRQLRHAELPFVFQAREHGESKLGTLVYWQFALLLVEKFSRGWIPMKVASFLAVGGSGLFVHMAVLYGLMAAGVGFEWGQTGASLTAMTYNFLLNNSLTFADRRFRGWGLLRGWLAYLLVCSVGLAANVSVASWAYQRMHGFAPLAALAGIAMDVLWKFVISDRLLWRRKR